MQEQQDKPHWALRIAHWSAMAAVKSCSKTKIKSSLFSYSSYVFPVAAFFFFFFLLSAYRHSQQYCFHQTHRSLQLHDARYHHDDHDPCAGRYIYVYDLPHRYNADIIRDCAKLSLWFDLCKSVVNSGIGPKIVDNSSTLPENGWYNTEQFLLDYIFHSRMKQYECLTTDYSKSAAVYIPYYHGLDVMRYLWGYNVSIRDALTDELMPWLTARPEWAARGGRDHFMAIGRISWDLQRSSNDDTQWGSKLLTLPEAKIMTLLIIETSTWRENEFGVPYPTYFHPSKESQVVTWQQKVRSEKRPHLFSFAGARRPNAIPTTRDLIIDQCANATLCKLQECGTGANDCSLPSNILRLFMSSSFCLQPPGDSFTRKSAFDSMLAGCIPVFFHPSSAYSQYRWYLLSNFNKFSVYIPEKAVREGTVRIEDVLLGYSDEQVHDMREQVISMIPTLVYKDPTAESDNFRDAFDVAVDGVLERIRSGLAL